MAAWQRQLPHGVKVGKVGTMLSGPSEVVHGNIVLEYVGGSIFPAGWWRAVEQRVGTRCEDGVPSPCSSPGWLPLSADGQCRWTISMDLPLCPAMSRVRLCHVCWEWLCVASLFAAVAMHLWIPKGSEAAAQPWSTSWVDPSIWGKLRQGVSMHLGRAPGISNHVRFPSRPKTCAARNELCARARGVPSLLHVCLLRALAWPWLGGDCEILVCRCARGRTRTFADIG